jgi:hypothetical protein
VPGRGSSRGLSDVVAFVLMFGIIITSVGLVATFGLTELEEFDRDQKLNNADRTFELIARSLDEIEESQATVRTDAIDLGGGSITVSPSSSVTVSVTGSGTSYTETFPLNTLVYESEDTMIGYENGATYRVRAQSDSGIINHEPGLICSDGTAVLSFVTVQGQEDRALGGSGTFRITGRLTNSTLLYPVARSGAGNASAADQVEMTYTFSGESRAREWANHFDRSQGDWIVTSETDTSVTVRCGDSDDLGQVYLRRSVITLAFS